ncbi:MAG: histidine kinase dimerization/phosphoacceptor domain -containing protein [Sphingobium sp.]|nr:DUF4118 domain-containing protein [Sphingobium sp.]MCP5399362.1 DUF4118 domain-containing protein [Sphingomonas sp.]
MDTRPTPFLEQLPLVSHRPWIAYPSTLALIAVAYVLRLLAQETLPNGFPYVTFFPAVIIASFLFGVGPGIVAGVIGGILSYSVFILPSQDYQHTLMGMIAMTLYIVVVSVDILLVHAMQRANMKLAGERERNGALAQTHEMLFHELQHRVSNNLQVVSALLNLKRRTIKDPQAQHVLDEAAQRLALIGRISRTLYNSGSGRYQLETFIHTLINDILEAHGRMNVKYSLDIDGGVGLPRGASVPTALIIAESVVNALEHGIQESSDGHIGISIKSGTEGIIVEVTDNGAGVPDDFSLDHAESYGLRIAQTFARQMKGSFDLIPGPGGGTAARLILPQAL